MTKQHLSKSSPQWQERWDRTAWFRDARFGMFIHWVLYAIPARGEWVRSFQRSTVEQYQTYFDEFNPTAYDPAEWARLAKKAGMKYAVLTAKHHDGFCLFDSALTDYKATNTPARRDLIREYVEAFRAEGLKVGLYYSLPDWHHPDYPAWKDRQHPMRDHPDWEHREHQWDRYVDYLHGQVRELVTNYGRIDLLWFDFSYHDKTGEAWRATDLVRMVREIQPHILIDNRLGGNLEKDPPDEFAGDFHGPEQGVPRNPMTNEVGDPLAWESCMTLNNSWGYNAKDHQYKPPRDVIRTLVNCVSKGGNLLINVGPDSLGRIPRESRDILLEVGQWLERNGGSIYGCGPAEGREKPEWGRYTQKGNVLFAHVMEQMMGHICLPDLKDKIARARYVPDGSEVLLTGFWNAEVDAFDGPDDIFMNWGLPVQATFPLPDPVDSVVALHLKE